MSDMTLNQAIAQRRAVRAYTADILSEPQVHALLDAAVRAPTAVHQEPWAFAIIQDRAVLHSLSDRAKKLALDDAKMRASPLGEMLARPEFNIFYDAGTLIVIGARRRSDFIEADCWLAAENLMLAACAMGLGTCVIGFAVAALQTASVKAELGIPADVLPVAPIIVGVPQESSAPTARRPPDIVVWTRERR